MICSTLASLRKIQYFRRPAYNPAQHIWWNFYYENGNLMSKKLHRRYLLEYYIRSVFWRLLKRSISLIKVFYILKLLKSVICLKYFIYFRARLHETRSELKTVWDFTWDKISFRCEVTSLSPFTWLRAEWNSLRCKLHFGQIDWSEILNRSEFSM